MCLWIHLGRKSVGTRRRLTPCSGGEAGFVRTSRCQLRRRLVWLQRDGGGSVTLAGPLLSCRPRAARTSVPARGQAGFGVGRRRRKGRGARWESGTSQARVPDTDVERDAACAALSCWPGEGWRRCRGGTGTRHGKQAQRLAGFLHELRSLDILYAHLIHIYSYNTLR